MSVLAIDHQLIRPTGGTRLSGSPGRRSSKAEVHWLDPAPFRAHVEHLMAASGLTARELGALTRVSVRLVRRLVNGRDGRPVRRIDPLSARRLLAVSALEACLVRSQQVPSGRSRARLVLLRERGRTPASLARLTGLSSTDLGRLWGGDLDTIPQLVELRLTAALAELDGKPERHAEPGGVGLVDAPAAAA